MVYGLWLMVNGERLKIKVKVNVKVETFMKRFLSVLTMMLLLLTAKAQESDLSRHNFLYAGQSKQLRLFKVENGRVSWMHHATNWRGEFSDAILMTDGHILLAHQYGIAEINQDHQVLWSYAAPPGTEIHTIQPIGQHHVVFVQNGHPALVRVMEIPSLKIVHEFEIPASRAFMDSSAMHGCLREGHCWYAI